MDNSSEDVLLIQTQKLLNICKNKILRLITEARWYIREKQLHADLDISTVAQVIQQYAVCYEARRHHHSNHLVLEQLDNADLQWRLQRKYPADLV